MASDEEIAASFKSAVQEIAGLAQSDALSTQQKGTFDDRYAHHTFVYLHADDYRVGSPGQIRGDPRTSGF